MQRKGLAFSEFTESTIHFMPTYKRVVGARTYDLHRKPAFTDRILYRTTVDAYDNVRLQLNQIYYSSHENYRDSDHLPVSSLFTIKVFNAIAFGSLHYLEEPLRISFLPVDDWKVGHDADAYFTISSRCPKSAPNWSHQLAESKLNEHDCIGLFRANFTSIEQHLTFVWVEPRVTAHPPPHVHTELAVDALELDAVGRQSLSSAMKTIKDQIWFRVTFADQAALVADSYRLLYISHRHNSILGMSAPFEITV